MSNSTVPTPAPQAASVLTAAEKSTLRSLERQVDSGLKQFVMVGLALSQIRDEKLYRETHKTFEEYCRERWDFGSSRARQLIAAADVAKSVTNVTVSNEATARAINAVPAEHREAVVESAAEKLNGKPLTAASIRKASNEARRRRGRARWEREQRAKSEQAAPVEADVSTPCPSCGCTERQTDDLGTCCAKCKEPIGAQVESVDGNVAPSLRVVDVDEPTVQADPSDWLAVAIAKLGEALELLDGLGSSAERLIEDVLILLESNQ